MRKTKKLTRSVYECMLMNAEGNIGTEAGGRAMARHSGVEKDFDTGEGEEETGRTGLFVCL